MDDIGVILPWNIQSHLGTLGRPNANKRKQGKKLPPKETKLLTFKKQREQTNSVDIERYVYILGSDVNTCVCVYIYCTDRDHNITNDKSFIDVTKLKQNHSSGHIFRQLCIWIGLKTVGKLPICCDMATTQGTSSLQKHPSIIHHLEDIYIYTYKYRSCQVPLL